MERAIETLAGGTGNTVASMAEHGVLFGIFVGVWIAFATGVIFSQGSVDQG